MTIYTGSLLIFNDLDRVTFEKGTDPEPVPDDSAAYIFRGKTNDFRSIWCDKNASLESGRFYVGRYNDLTIINVISNKPFIEDYYSKTLEGKTGDTLSNENIVDINVIT